MKFFLLFQILALFIASCTNGQENSLTANEIFNNHLETIGERKTVLNIKTYSHSTSFVLPNYGKFILNVKIKIPDKVHIEKIFPDSTKEITIFNKDKGIIKSANEDIILSKKEVEQFKTMSLVFTEFHFKELGYKVKLAGQETINGKKCYKLEINTNLETLYYLIEKKTFHILRSVSKNRFSEIIESHKINGINLTKSWRSISGSDTTIWENYNQQFNVEINDNIFKID